MCMFASTFQTPSYQITVNKQHWPEGSGPHTDNYHQSDNAAI